MGSCSLLQGIFPNQQSNQGLLHCRRILYQLSHQGSPKINKYNFYIFMTNFRIWTLNLPQKNQSVCFLFFFFKLGNVKAGGDHVVNFSCSKASWERRDKLEVLENCIVNCCQRFCSLCKRCALLHCSLFCTNSKYCLSCLFVFVLIAGHFIYKVGWL